MMAEQPEAKNNVEYRWQDTGLSENPVSLFAALHSKIYDLFAMSPCFTRVGKRLWEDLS
jgi:hypothetical protein